MPDTLPGEARPPAKQKLTEEERRAKEAVLFDSNLGVLSNLLHSKTFDGHLVTPVKVPCGAATSVCEDDITLDQYSDYEDVKRYFKVGLSTVYATPALAKIDKEWQVYSKHVDKRHYSVVYRKCGERGCNYCSQHPIRCKDVLVDLPTPEQGALFYAPTPAADDSGQYKTYLEMKAAGKKLVYKPAGGLSVVTGRCTEPGCCWVFTSAAVKERHVRLVHRKKESRKSGSDSMHSECDSAPQAKKQKVYKTCNVCLKAFPSAHYLTKHKQEAGHKKK